MFDIIFGIPFLQSEVMWGTVLYHVCFYIVITTIIVIKFGEHKTYTHIPLIGWIIAPIRFIFYTIPCAFLNFGKAVGRLVKNTILNVLNLKDKIKKCI